MLFSRKKKTAQKIGGHVAKEAPIVTTNIVKGQEVPRSGFATKTPSPTKKQRVRKISVAIREQKEDSRKAGWIEQKSVKRSKVKTKLILLEAAPSSPADAFAEEAISQEYLTETSNLLQADQVKTTTFQCNTLRQGPRVLQKSTASLRQDPWVS